MRFATVISAFVLFYLLDTVKIGKVHNVYIIILEDKHSIANNLGADKG